MSSTSISDLSASSSGYYAQSSDVFSSADTARTLTIKQQHSSGFSISDYLCFPSSPPADKTLTRSALPNTPKAGKDASDVSLNTPTLRSLHSSSSPFPAYSTPPSAKRTTPSAIFSPSKVPTPKALPLSFPSSPCYASPAKENLSPARRSAAPSPDSARKAPAARRELARWAMATIAEDEVLEDFVVPEPEGMAMDLDEDERDDPGFSSDTCEALTTYLNLPDEDDMQRMLHSTAAYDGASVAQEPLAKGDTSCGKRTFSVCGWGDEEEVRSQHILGLRPLAPDMRLRREGRSDPSTTLGEPIERVLSGFGDTSGPCLGEHSGDPASTTITASHSWDRYTSRARDDPAWLAYRPRGAAMSTGRSLKRKTARISRSVDSGEKENNAEAPFFVKADVTCGKPGTQSAHAATPLDKTAPAPAGSAFWAGGDPATYAMPLPYFAGCLPADRALMHGVNELSVLRGASQEACHTVPAAPLQRASQESLPPWRTIASSFWVE